MQEGAVLMRNDLTPNVGLLQNADNLQDVSFCMSRSKARLCDESQLPPRGRCPHIDHTCTILCRGHAWCANKPDTCANTGPKAYLEDIH